LGAESSGCVWETSIPRLKLRHTWTTTMSSNDYRDTIQARIQARTSDGVTGVGGRRAHCPISRECGGRQKAIEGIASFLQGADPSRYEKVMAEISRRMLNQFAAKMKEASLAMLGQTSGARHRNGERRRAVFFVLFLRHVKTASQVVLRQVQTRKLKAPRRQPS
jgi:hypothetical protein